MKRIKHIIKWIIFLICYVGFSQCDNEFYAFYYYPVYEYENDKRIKIVFKNASDIANWTMDIEIVPKGTPPTSESVFTVHFRELDHELPYGFSLDQYNSNFFDLYACGEQIGEFQREHALLEIHVDFEYEKNRLYFFPFKNVSNGDLIYPDFTEARIDFDKRVIENDSTYFNTAIYQDPIESRVDFKRLEAFRFEDAKIKVSFDFKVISPTPVSFIILNGKTSDLDLYLHPGIFIDINNPNWVNYEKIFDLSTMEPIELSGGFDNTDFFSFLFGSLSFAVVPIPENTFIDNIHMEVLGDRKEICYGDSIEIGKQIIREPGIYGKTILTNFGNDSTVYTTVVYHPSLFATKIVDGEYIANGDWENYEWKNCETNEIVGTGNNFIALEPGSYYVIASSANCSDSSTCFNVLDMDTINPAATPLTIYPNPAGDWVNVIIESNEGKELTLTDITGIVLKRIPIISGQLDYQIDMAHYSDGMYFLILIENHRIIKSGKLIIHK